ncbi:23296_t:CDS:2 [Cetraspora pellucida]|uniref:23296_t:CDS:1 n=1 Tax=Cetraspora pellucida TaxID=1433469 RepID=A0A9N9I1E2_9GLOM|nr:23296_t:CDS:2 [Cetraspora pellucida]
MLSMPSPGVLTPFRTNQNDYDHISNEPASVYVLNPDSSDKQNSITSEELSNENDDLFESLEVQELFKSLEV